MRSGRKVFSYPKGTYTPIISDGQNLYVTGYSSITKLAPTRPRPARISPAIVAPKPRFPSHMFGKAISKGFVAPAVKPLELTPRQRQRLRQMAPARRRATIRALRRRAAAGADAAPPARTTGTARRGDDR
jgi:hypothetical protein